MNEQELPEEGATPDRPIGTGGAESAKLAHQSFELDEDSDDFDDDEEFEDHDDDEEFASEEDVRSMVEQLFDDTGLEDMMTELDVLTLEDAAAYLKVDYGQIRRLIKEQGLPGRKIGDEWRFLRGAIADWLRAPGGNPPVAPTPDRSDRPAQPERREPAKRPPLNERFQQSEGRPGRYPQQGKPPRRYQDEGTSQGGYQPPRKPRYGNDLGQGQGQYQPPPRQPYGQRGNSGDQGGGHFSGGGGGGPRKQGGAGPKKPKRKSLNEQRFKRLDRRKFGNGGDQDSTQ